jgi:hypothetical protein
MVVWLMVSLVVVKTRGIGQDCSGSSFVVLYRVVVVWVLAVKRMEQRLGNWVEPMVVFSVVALMLAGARMRNLVKVVVDLGSLVLVRDQAQAPHPVLALILAQTPVLDLPLVLLPLLALATWSEMKTEPGSQDYMKKTTVLVTDFQLAMRISLATSPPQAQVPQTE